ncbi:MAG: bifunctional riboflavin kinase/FAD synthetase [Paludibacteraceae bacterium]|nr:bifunctional riboflavin kinase/FAD synthetase [Paludibacteraceae bacterium]
MEFIEDIEHFENEGLALTIGFFDGVHAGHRYLIDQVRAVADDEHLKAAIFTFWPHPRITLNEHYKPNLLNSLDEKKELLMSSPLDYCIMTDFSMDLANLVAFDFMKEVLVKKLNVKHLIVGYDHRFGRNREEGFDDYVKHGLELGIKVTQADPYSDNNYTISSSFIRQLLAVGEINMANHYLGYPYALSGTVEKGQQVGRTIGFPTANLKLNIPNKCLPKIGVYAAMVGVGDKHYKSMLYIGTRPTTTVDELSIEAHLFNYEGDLYGQDITIYVEDRIRNQHKFEDLATLKKQLQKDARMAQKILMRF